MTAVGAERPSRPVSPLSPRPHASAYVTNSRRPSLFILNAGNVIRAVTVHPSRVIEVIRRWHGLHRAAPSTTISASENLSGRDALRT